MEGVLVTGTAVGTMSGECGRCLDPVGRRLSVDLMELYQLPRAGQRRRAAATKTVNGAPLDDDELPDAGR